jgi:hypothetical protein
VSFYFLKGLRRKIESRIEPHPFAEENFVETIPIVHEIIKFGQDTKPQIARSRKKSLQPKEILCKIP